MFFEYPKAMYRGETETAIVQDAESEAAKVADGWRTSLLPLAAAVDEAPVDKPKRKPAKESDKGPEEAA